jgi:hypothetical protein
MSDNFDQIVKGSVRIKRLSEYRYRITFSKISKFLLYQVWDKDNTNNIDDKRSIYYLSANHWVYLFKKNNEDSGKHNKPLFTPTTIMETKNYDRYAFVIHRAYGNSNGKVVFTVSTKEISLGNNSLKNLIQLPLGKCNNVRFDIDDNKSHGGDPNRGVKYCHEVYGHPCNPDEVIEWKKKYTCPTNEGKPSWAWEDTNCGTGCLSLQTDWLGGLHCANY